MLSAIGAMLDARALKVLLYPADVPEVYLLLSLLKPGLSRLKDPLAIRSRSNMLTSGRAVGGMSVREDVVVLYLSIIGEEGTIGSSGGESAMVAVWGGVGLAFPRVGSGLSKTAARAVYPMPAAGSI